MDRKYGWKRDKEDRRDYRYNVKMAKMFIAQALPESVDLEDKNPPIYDQANLGSCFTGDTEIPLLNGEHKTLKELYESGESFWVYSIDENGKTVPGKAKCNFTGNNKAVIKITLDNYRVIFCTPEHQFMTRDGLYVEAEKLIETNSLMPLYRRWDKRGYEIVFEMQITNITALIGW